MGKHPFSLFGDATDCSAPGTLDAREDLRCNLWVSFEEAVQRMPDINSSATLNLKLKLLYDLAHECREVVRLPGRDQIGVNNNFPILIQHAGPFQPQRSQRTQRNTIFSKTLAR
jgi:hypothetical protein